MTTSRDPAQSRRNVAFAIALGSLAISGCGGQPPSEIAPYMVQLDPRTDGRLWVTDDASRSFILDTGTPRTTISPRVFGQDADSFEERAVSVADWRDPASLNDGSTPLIVVEPAAFFAVDGVIGMDLLGPHSLSWLPPSNLQIGPPGYRPELGRPRVDLPIELLGGGRTCFGADRCVDYGATRSVIEITIEGVQVHALLDTASRDLTITDDLLFELREDRPMRQIDVEGADRLRFTRVDEVEMGRLRLDRVFTRVLDVNASVERLRIETGVLIRAIVGTAPLRQFWPTIDPSGGSLSLSVGPETTHSVGNAKGLGYGTKVDRGCVRVVLLAAGLSPAGNGMRLGDCVTRVQTSGGDLAEIDQMIEAAATYPVGTPFVTWVRRDEGELRVDATIEFFLPEATDTNVQLLE